MENQTQNNISPMAFLTVSQIREIGGSELVQETLIDEVFRRLHEKDAVITELRREIAELKQSLKHD
jgi:fructose-1,6-bisphosphatase